MTFDEKCIRDHCGCVRVIVYIPTYKVYIYIYQRWFAPLLCILVLTLRGVEFASLLMVLCWYGTAVCKILLKWCILYVSVEIIIVHHFGYMLYIHDGYIMYCGLIHCAWSHIGWLISGIGNAGGEWVMGEWGAFGLRGACGLLGLQYMVWGRCIGILRIYIHVCECTYRCSLRAQALY